MNDQSASSTFESFRDPNDMPGPLSADVAARIVAMAGDVAFVLDGQGIILDAAISSADVASDGFGEWIGETLLERVTIESEPKVREMLSAAKAGAPARWRQVNHATPHGDVPVRYMIVGAGRPERFIAIGRDMRGMAAMQQRLLQTQQSLERDYLRLRQAESRYRLLFDMAGEAMLIVDAANRRIREANASAHRLLDAKDGTLSGQPATVVVSAHDQDELVGFLGAAAAGDVPATTLHLAGAESSVRMTASLFRQDRSAYLLLRLAPVTATAREDGRELQICGVVERMPDAFVLADRTLVVRAVNAAFVELAHARSAEQVTGAKLGTWLGRPGIDLDLIVVQLRDHGSVRNVATIMRGNDGAQEEVEVSAVLAPHGDEEYYGFTIRSVARRMRDLPPVERDLPRSVEQLTELVGRMSLKEIVRESTDLIERLCIEAALTYTADNRASAAEILGVSRQSLYSKLHRHGLGNLVPGSES